MGNKSSTPHWHPHYYAPPPHPHLAAHPMGRSMVNLSGGDYPDWKRGSRISLHHAAGYPEMVMLPPDPKMLKKIEKRQRKLAKKMGGRVPPMPMQLGFHPHPPLPQQHPFGRAMSFDDLRRGVVELETPRDSWTSRTEPRADRRESYHPRTHQGVLRGRVASPRERREREVYESRQRIHHITHTGKRHEERREASAPTPGSLESSSPLTSASSRHTAEWTDSGRGDSGQPSPNRDERPQMRVNRVLTSPRQSGDKLERQRKASSVFVPPSSPSPIPVAVLRKECVSSSRSDESSGRGSCTYAHPLPRLATGSSSGRSSAATSRRGDHSEIDFSWVQDEESRIQSESATSPLPKCYFGMQPPPIEEVEAAAARQAREAESERRREMDETAERRRLHLDEIRRRGDSHNVRAKTALFELEARLADRDKSTPPHHHSTPQLVSPREREVRETREIRERLFSPSERRINRVQQAREQECVQRQRVYDSTEYYRERERERQRWRSSMAI